MEAVVSADASGVGFAAEATLMAKNASPSPHIFRAEEYHGMSGEAQVKIFGGKFYV